MDSGIKVNAELVADLLTMKETAKCIYDYIVMSIEVDPNAPPPKGTKSPTEHVVTIDKVPKGECATAYEGKDLQGVDIVHQAIYDYVETKLKNKCAMFAYYVKCPGADGVNKDKFITINWVPDTAPMKLKMRYSSTFKTVNTKAPKVNAKVEAHDLEDLKFKHVLSQIS